MKAVAQGGVAGTQAQYLYGQNRCTVQSHKSMGWPNKLHGLAIRPL